MTTSRLFIPLRASLYETVRAFSPAEKALLSFFVLMFVTSGIVLFDHYNNFTEVPLQGGAITEGVIGSPRFINPLLSISDSDRDLTMLVYSGLIKVARNGDLMPDLAESYSISEDGKTYTFILKENITFHDGTPVTTDDIVFTVTMTQNSTLKSPIRANWDGVIVQKVDERTVEFILPQPYAPFLENTALGILPKHIWENVSPEQFPFSQFNVEPIGSGPFLVSNTKRNNSGLPDFYKLSPFSNYALGKPYLDALTLRFYTNEDDLITAYKNGEVDSINSISPENAQKFIGKAHIETSPLPRIFGIFFNQNQKEIFTDQGLREALNSAIPKNRITNEVLAGFGTTIDSPIPPGVISTQTSEEKIEEPDLNAIRAQLTEAGWAREGETGILIKETDDGIQRLSFSISTSNTLELKSVASIVAEAWRELGAEIDLRFFETSDLNQNVIRPRDYDALLFGEIVGRELDLFSFWHSSQRNDPGLNIALYANITSDKLLEDARANTGREERYALYGQFEKEVKKETPAIFLYSPLFIYIVSEKIRNLSLGPVTTPAERFLNVHEWYTETEDVWPIFTK